MTIPCTIVIVGGAPLPTWLLDEVAAGVLGLGHHLTRYPDAQAFFRAPQGLIDADALVATPNFPCSRALMAEAPRLRAVISPVTGVEGFDERGATDLGILVANGQTPETYHGMAEATILLMLAALYDLHGSEAVLRQNRPRPPRNTARMLSGKTIGLIGFGQIARAMVSRLAGWGVQMQVHSRRVHEDAPPEITWTGLEDLLRTSDVVCVLASLNADTEHLLTADRLRLLKREAVLINTARGAIIDETALAAVAQERPDLRLALDTFTVEPLPAESPLRDLPQTILTPHMVGHTREVQAGGVGVVIESLRRVLAGELPPYVRNPEVIARWGTPREGSVTAERPHSSA